VHFFETLVSESISPTDTSRATTLINIKGAPFDPSNNFKLRWIGVKRYTQRDRESPTFVTAILASETTESESVSE